MALRMQKISLDYRSLTISGGDLMTHKYPRVYKALKELGFSPHRALDVLLDAKRKLPQGLMFVRIAHRVHREHGARV
jgi:hypothetical protein